MISSCSRVILVLALAVPLWPRSAVADSSPHDVAVSVAPLASIVEAIGGDHVDVTIMVPPGSSPATYEPTPRQMAGLTSSVLYVSVGLPRERTWLSQIRATHPDLPILDLPAIVQTRPINAHGHGHDEAPDHDHGSEGERPDPHIWLGPAQLRTIARAVRDELSRIAPALADELAANTDDWLARLDAADEVARQRLRPYAGRAFLIFHPALGYFADAYGLRQIAIEKYGMEPGPRMIAASIEAARAQDIQVVFVQAQFSEDSARTIAAEIDGSVVRLDPLAPDPIETILTVMEALSEALG
jgi:zinc transport system substrate-binding protein